MAPQAAWPHGWAAHLAIDDLCLQLTKNTDTPVQRAHAFSLIALSFLAISILGGLFWINLWISQQWAGGQDFAVYWASARALLEFEADPYGELASLNAQQAVHEPTPGAATPGFRLDLPLQAEMLAFPLAAIPEFETARALWMLLLECALFGTSLLCLRVLGSKPRISAFLLPLFGVFWLQAIWPLSEGNAIIVATFFVVAGLVALQGTREEAAGVLLALGTFKFLTLGPFLLLVVVWSLFRRNWRLPVAYLLSLAILVVVSFLFFPNWLLPYLRAVIVDLRAIDVVSTGKIISSSFPAIGVRFSQILTALAAGLILWEWWSARHGGYRHMLWAACLTLSLTPLLGLPTNPQNYAILILPTSFFILLVEERWSGSGRALVLGFLIALFVGLWFIFLATARPSVALFFPAPVVLTLALYWIRWWAIKPPRTWADTVTA